MFRVPKIFIGYENIRGGGDLRGFFFKREFFVAGFLCGTRQGKQTPNFAKKHRSMWKCATMKNMEHESSWGYAVYDWV